MWTAINTELKSSSHETKNASVLVDILWTRDGIAVKLNLNLPTRDDNKETKHMRSELIF